MEEEINNKPLTIKDFREVMVPAMEEIFITKKEFEKFVTKDEMQTFQKWAIEVFATKQDLEKFTTDEEFAKFRNSSLLNQDKILKNLDTLMTEKTVRNYQKEKERKL